MNRYYCYVSVANQAPTTEGKKYARNEIINELEKVAEYVSLGYSEPNAIYLRDVKRGSELVQINGLFKTNTKSEMTYGRFPILCKVENQNTIIDIITGKSYILAKGYGRYTYDGPELAFRPAKGISSEELVKFLKTLTDRDIARYKAQLAKLELGIARGYQKDLNKYNEETNETDNFIKTFQKKYNDPNNTPNNRK